LVSYIHKQLIYHYLVSNLDNWYEDRLALEQDYRVNPDKRVVSIISYFACLSDNLFIET
jgi:hypothetical protein